MYYNSDVPKLDNALNRYAKICKKIGSYDYQLEVALSKYFLDQGNERLELHIDELKQYRANLENQKAKAEVKIYEAFEQV